MRWRLILEEFGPNIQHIAGVDNIVADTLSRLPSANIERDDPSTSQGQFRANEFFAFNAQAVDDGFPLALLTVQQEQNKELELKNSKLKTNLKDKESGYNKQDLNGIEIIFHKNKIYVPTSLVTKPSISLTPGARSSAQ